MRTTENFDKFIILYANLKLVAQVYSRKHWGFSIAHQPSSCVFVDHFKLRPSIRAEQHSNTRTNELQHVFTFSLSSYNCIALYCTSRFIRVPAFVASYAVHATWDLLIGAAAAFYFQMLFTMLYIYICICYNLHSIQLMPIQWHYSRVLYVLVYCICTSTLYVWGYVQCTRTVLIKELPVFICNCSTVQIAKICWKYLEARIYSLHYIVCTV